jgi:hypothetical protein
MRDIGCQTHSSSVSLKNSSSSDKGIIPTRNSKDVRLEKSGHILSKIQESPSTQASTSKFSAKGTPGRSSRPESHFPSASSERRAIEDSDMDVGPERTAFQVFNK